VSKAGSPLDVVTVPDFDGPDRDLFEARTLLFLACWFEFGGDARSYPLHVACIGEPPASVRRLAGRCGALLHAFPALPRGTFRGLNKLRGLEVPARSDRLLLLDTDVLVLSDFSGIATLGPTIAASPAVRARVPADYWVRIYEALGVPAPATRVVSLVGRFNAGHLDPPAYPDQLTESRSMLPYYNGGVLLLPHDAGLRAQWESHVAIIDSLFGPGVLARGAVAASDQAGLAAAVVALGRQGVPFTHLADSFHATWLHLYRRALPLDDVRFFHAFGLARARSARRGVTFRTDDYCWQLARRLAATWRGDLEGPSGLSTCRKYLLPALLDVVRLRQKLRLAYLKHVRPALADGARQTSVAS
jgi:hypothetical protein